MSACRVYTCGCCGREFHNEAGWTDADALMEYQDVFSERERLSDPVVVCDPCYQAMMKAVPPQDFTH